MNRCPLNVSDVIAISGTSAANATALVARTIYRLCSNTSCWVLQGAAPVATVGSGSTFLPAGVEMWIDGSLGAHVAVIQDAAAGHASLTKMRVFGP